MQLTWFIYNELAKSIDIGYEPKELIDEKIHKGGKINEKNRNRQNKS